MSTRTGAQIIAGGLFFARLGTALASVLRLILKQGMSLVGARVAIGFAAALLAGPAPEQNAVRHKGKRSRQRSSGGDGVVACRAASVLLAGSLG